MKKVISMILVISMLFVMGGCSKSQETTTTDKDKATTEVKQTSGKLSGKIELFNRKNEAVEIWEELVKEFNKEYPDIEVEVLTVPDSSQVLVTRMMNGETPDMFTAWPPEPDYRIQCDEGFMYDMSNESFLDNVKPEILERSKYDGKYQSLPISLNSMGIYYNKAIFKDLGLEVPRSQSEFFAMLDKIVDAGITPFCFADKDSWTLGQFLDRVMGLYIDDVKGTFFEKVARGEASCTESEELRKIGELALKLREYAKPDSLGTGYEQAISAFANGEVALFYQTSAAIPAIKSANPDLDFEIFALPAENEKDTRYPTNIDNALCISAESENIELCKAFLEFVSRPATARIYADLDGSPSAIKDVEFDVPQLQDVAKYFAEGKDYEVPQNYWAPGLYGDMKNLAQNLVANEDVNAFLEGMDKAVNERYNDK